MGLGTKLTFAFLVVILVMAAGHAGYSFFLDWQNSHAEAEKHLLAVLHRLPKQAAHPEVITEFEQVAETDLKAAAAIVKEPSFLAAFAARDREAIAAAVAAYINARGIDCFVTVADGEGKVIYGSDAPAKFGYPIADKCSGVKTILTAGGSKWGGFADFSPTGEVTLTFLAPVKEASAAGGLVAVSQPLSSEYLNGLASKFQFIDNPPFLGGVDMALFSAGSKKITAFTSRLPGNDNGFLSRVNEQGHVPAKEFETGSQLLPSGGRLWMPLVLQEGNPAATVAVLLLTFPLPSLLPQLGRYAGEIAVTSTVALVLAFIFATTLSGGVRQSLRFLIGRAHDLAAQKANLAPLEGLEGDFLELGELMDTAVTSMRSTISSLKSQLARESMKAGDTGKQDDYSSEQLVSLNRQLSEKTRQATELSKQINLSAQQIALLQHKLDAILQISTEGFLVLDQYGNVLSANPAFLNWMGVKEGEIAGRFCFDLVKKPGQPASELSGQAFVRHAGNSGDLISQFYAEGIIYHRHQDKSVEVLSHLQPVVTDDQNLKAWIMVLRDKSLRSEVAQLRSEIVDMLCDSIRSPLASLEASWGELLSGAATKMSPATGQALAELHIKYEQLIGLVDSLLLMYGGIAPPPLIPRQMLAVTRLIAECLEQVAGAARERKLALDHKTATGLPNLNTDRETLKRVLLQLLDKMINMTTPGGRVRVESLLKGRVMLIGVTSTGPCLSKEEIEDMFAGFIADKHNQESYGERLALYLARNNIERLGGKIWAESDPDKGSAIYLSLPI